MTNKQFLRHVGKEMNEALFAKGCLRPDEIDAARQFSKAIRSCVLHILRDDCKANPINIAALLKIYELDKKLATWINSCDETDY